MENKTVAIKIGDYLYKHCFGAYKILYPIMKHYQDGAEIKLIKANVNSGDTVLDIGANIGFVTRIMSRSVGKQGCVYAFEPDEVNFRHLQAATQSLSNVTLKHAAVSNTSGTITVYKSPMLNVDHRTYPIDDYTSKSEVACLSIDDFLPEDTKLDFIKMDIQGYEFTALQGMKNTLMRNRDHLKLFMELWPAGLKRAGSSASAVIAFLEKCGFQPHLQRGQRLSPLTSLQAKDYDDEPDNIYFNIFVKKAIEK